MEEAGTITTNPVKWMWQEREIERALESPLPPGPANFSMARTRRFVDEPLQLLLEAYHEFGPIFTMRIFTSPTVWMLGPEANNFMLVSGTRHFRWRDGFMGNLIPLIGDGLLTTDGATHDRARKTITPVFHRRSVEALTRVMVQEADAAVDSLTVGEETDMYIWARRLAMGIAMRGLFGLEADGTRRERFATMFEDALGYYYEQIWRQVLRGPRTAFTRMQDNRTDLDAALFPEIAARRSDPRGEDILTLLVGAQSEDGSTFSDQEIRDQMMTLLFAGHDTTTSTISFMLYELSRNPEALDALVAEIDETLGGAEPSPAQLFDGLPQLEATLAETLRLYPAAWQGPRRVVESFEFAGHRVPAGVMAGYSSWVSHRIPEVFHDPEAFIPERFAEGEIAGLPRGAYVPFGAGTRICVGKRFGETEIKAIVIRLLQRFRPELAPGYRLRIRQAPTLSPLDGMPIRLRPRA